MTKYHSVMIGEDGMEFGADCEAATRSEAHEWFDEQYPESRVVQLESPEDSAAREATTYDLIRRGADFDDDGRPFFPNGDEDDWDDGEDDYDDLDADDEENL